MTSEPNSPAPDEPTSIFPVTRWSLVARLQGEPGAEAERALGDLCQTYWYPLYAFARSRGLSPHDAEDSTQGFFQRLLALGSLETVGAERGRLRAVLLASMKNFLSSQWRDEKALKRGGGQRVLSIDQDWAEDALAAQVGAAGSQPEVIFDRGWALSMLNEVSRQLERHYDSTGKRELYEAIKGCLEGDGTYEAGAELAGRLGMSPEGVRSAVFKLRRRFREFVEEAVSDTCADEAEAKEEIAHLCRIMAQ